MTTARGATIRLHRADGTVRAKLDGNTEKVRSVAFDSTGRTLISSVADGPVYVWAVP